MRPDLDAVTKFLKDEYASEGARIRGADPVSAAAQRGAGASDPAQRDPLPAADPRSGSGSRRGAVRRLCLGSRCAGPRSATHARRRAAGFEITGTESNSLHVTLPATTENLTEVLAELEARFGIEADLSLTPTGANLVLWVPAAVEAEPAPAAPVGRLSVAGGLLLGMAMVGWAHAVMPDGPGAPPPLPSNWSSYIWPW